MAFVREDIERVRSATNIVDLVDSVTTVRKRGRAVKAICPFHQEKTASMSIDVGRGLYHCFGCGAGGDIFKFVQETQALDFSEAVEFLAARAGVTLRIDKEAALKRSKRPSSSITIVSRMLQTQPGRGSTCADAGTTPT